MFFFEANATIIGLLLKVNLELNKLSAEIRTINKGMLVRRQTNYPVQREGLTLEKSAFEFHRGGSFFLVSAQMISNIESFHITPLRCSPQFQWKQIFSPFITLAQGQEM